MPYEDELMEVEHIYAALVDRYASDFEALNITALVEELGEALPEYRAALEPEQRVTSQMVRAAADEMHLALVEVVAYVLGRLSGPGLAEVRDRLLAGVVEQDDRLREALIARRRAGGGTSVDVDGDGIYDEGEAAGEPVAPGDAQAGVGWEVEGGAGDGTGGMTPGGALPGDGMGGGGPISGGTGEGSAGGALPAGGGPVGSAVGSPVGGGPVSGGVGDGTVGGGGTA